MPGEGFADGSRGASQSNDFARHFDELKRTPFAEGAGQRWIAHLQQVVQRCV
jgi:hypothetical protein